MFRLFLLYFGDITIFLVCFLFRDGRFNGFLINISYLFFLKFVLFLLLLKLIFKFLLWLFLLCGSGKFVFFLLICIFILWIKLLFFVVNWIFFCVFFLSFLYVILIRRFRMDLEMLLNKKRIIILNNFFDLIYEKIF